MTYSCSDFTDTILNALHIVVPEDARDDPRAQAILALVEIGRLRDDAEKRKVVWVLHISHKHGDSYWVYNGEEEAKGRLVGWASEWWEKEIPDKPIPDDDAELILEYFPAADEQWTIEQTDLNPAD
jgi:hypothetical protein